MKFKFSLLTCPTHGRAIKDVNVEVFYGNISWTGLACKKIFGFLFYYKFEAEK